MTTRVLFVCLGNICRSPTAHGVMEHLLREEAPELQVEVDSAGTGSWHVGHPPDPRSQEAAARRGYDISHVRARRVVPEDLMSFDFVLAMDRSNLEVLSDLHDGSDRVHVGLFLDFHPESPVPEVPDPYYGGGNGFEKVLDLVEAACRGLIEEIRQRPG